METRRNKLITQLKHKSGRAPRMLINVEICVMSVRKEMTNSRNLIEKRKKQSKSRLKTTMLVSHTY